MSTDERDTHFANASKLVTIQLYRRFGYGIDLTDEDDKEWHTLIARFAYDLTMYNLKSFFDRAFGGTSYYDPEEIIRD